jgi:hypothetical protein
MQLLNFGAHYLKIVFGNIWGILLALSTALGLGERFIEKKIKIPLWVRITLIVGIVFTAQAVAYKQLVDVPPTVLRTPAPPAPIIQKQEPTPNVVRSAVPKPDTKPPVQVNNAPNGFAIGGGTVTNPTVNNFGPPLAHLSHTEEVVTSSSPSDTGLKIMKVHISTDRPIPGAIVGIRFSGPIEPITPGQDEPEMKGTGAFQVNWGTVANNKVLIPNSLAITINIPAVFLPNEELVVTVKSKTEVSILEVGQIH